MSGVGNESKSKGSGKSKSKSKSTCRDKSHERTRTRRAKKREEGSAARSAAFVLELKLPSSPRFLSLMRSCIDEAGRARGIGREILETFKSAVSEAVNNAIKHAYRFDETGWVHLRFQVAHDRMTVIVTYEDPDFDPATIPQPELGTMKEGGYGVFLMRQLMDEVVYERPDARTVRLRLTKSWKGN